MPYADKYVSQENDLPVEPHWAILKFTTVSIPGDERSRTNPGHGYPAHTQSVVRYEAYLTESAWLEAIKVLEAGHYSYTSYKAMKVIPHTVTREIKEGAA